MAAKVGSDCVKFVFNDVWKLLTNKEGWSHKKGSALDTDWWVLPHAKSKKKVELVQKVDYVKTDIEVIGHVLNSDKRAVLFGFSPELDSAVASVIIAEHTKSPNIDLELKSPSIDQFMESKEGSWFEVEGRDNIAVENTFHTHNEGWEQGVAIRTHEHVVVHYKSGLVEIFYDNSAETKDDGSFLLQWNEHYFRGLQKPAEQTSPLEVLTATTAADNSTVSSSGSSAELNANSSTETDSAPENSTDTAVEQHENVQKLADEAQAKEQARQSERATKREQCAQFSANMKVVIKSAAGAKCRKDLPENGSEGKVAPTYDHTCEMNDGYVLVSYAYQGVDLKVNHFPACDLSVVVDMPEDKAWAAINKGNTMAEYGRCEEKYTTHAYFSCMPIATGSEWQPSYYAAMAVKMWSGGTQFTKVGQSANGDLVIAIERDRHGITKLVVASPSPLKDKSGSPEIKWLSVWDHTKITPETTESVRAAVEIAEKILKPLIETQHKPVDTEGTVAQQRMSSAVEELQREQALMEVMAAERTKNEEERAKKEAERKEKDRIRKEEQAARNRQRAQEKKALKEATEAKKKAAAEKKRKAKPDNTDDINRATAVQKVGGGGGSDTTDVSNFMKTTALILEQITDKLGVVETKIKEQVAEGQKKNEERFERLESQIARPPAPPVDPMTHTKQILEMLLMMQGALPPRVNQLALPMSSAFTQPPQQVGTAPMALNNNWLQPQHQQLQPQSHVRGLGGQQYHTSGTGAPNVPAAQQLMQLNQQQHRHQQQQQQQQQQQHP